MRIQSFEELKIWKDAIDITLKIYPLTNKDTFSKDFALREQIRKALISITSNIEEGFEKNNNKDFIRFLYYSKGSAGEVRSQLYIANKLGYISDEDYNNFKFLLIDISKQIKGFIEYLRNRENIREK